MFRVQTFNELGIDRFITGDTSRLDLSGNSRLQFFAMLVRAKCQSSSACGPTALSATALNPAKRLPVFADASSVEIPNLRATCSIVVGDCAPFWIKSRERERSSPSGMADAASLSMAELAWSICTTSAAAGVSVLLVVSVFGSIGALLFFGAPCSKGRGVLAT